MLSKVCDSFLESVVGGFQGVDTFAHWRHGAGAERLDHLQIGLGRGASSEQRRGGEHFLTLESCASRGLFLVRQIYGWMILLFEKDQ